MDSTQIATFLPIIIMLVVVFSDSAINHKWLIIKKQKGKRGLYHMSDYLKKYIGEKCFITTGSFGSSLSGKIIAIEDKWIEIQSKENKPVEIVNLEFVQRIRIQSK